MTFISARTTRRPRQSHPHRGAARVAVGALIALGFVVAAPGGGAFAVVPDTPQARVARSIEQGHLVDDLAAGRITEADLTTVAATGLDVGGRRIENWVDRTAAQDAAVERTLSTPAGRDLVAALRTAPSSPDEAAPTQPAGPPSVPGASGPRGVVTADHWWSHIHLPTIKNQTVYLSNAVVRAIVVSGVAAVTAAVCIRFRLSKGNCAALGAFLLGGSEFVRTSGICQARGAYVVLPEVWRSHCA